MLSKLLGWFRHRTTSETPSSHRVYVSLHRGGLIDVPDAAGMAALGLHDALTARKTPCALVDVDEWILRTALEEGRFRPIDICEAEELDDLTGEPAWERERRADISWLLHNRSELVRSALRSGGDAQVVILLHSLEFMELLTLWGEKRRDDVVLLYYLGANQPGLPGFACEPMNPGKGGPAFTFGDNPADDEVSWGRLAKRISKLLG
jgi:hypothetical protein